MTNKRTPEQQAAIDKRMIGLNKVNAEKQERMSRKKLIKEVKDRLVNFDSRHDVYTYILDNFDRKPDDAVAIINEALLDIQTVNDRTITNLNALTCERLEKAAKQAYKDGKVKDAIAAIKMMNDMVYEARQANSKEDNEWKMEFGLRDENNKN